MTSAWRQAINGRAQCIRSAKNIISTELHERYYSSSRALFQATQGNPLKTMLAARQTARLFTTSLVKNLSECEPIFLDKATFERVDAETRTGSPLKLSGNNVYSPERIPIPRGLLWLEEAPQISIEPKDNPPGVNVPQTNFTLAALYFGPTVSYTRKPGDHQLKRNEERTGLGIVAFVSDYGDSLLNAPREYLAPLIIETCIYGQTLAERFTLMAVQHPDRTDLLLQVWASEFLWELFNYMQQRLVTTETSQTQHRGSLRELRRQGYMPTVQIVRWRKEEPRVTDPEHESADVAWSCHWRVKQHTRRYKSGKVVTVRPYLKGDRSKPFKQPNLIVNVVDR